MRQPESPTRALQILYQKIRREWKIAFLACFLVGLAVHMPVLVLDIPNHDGLDSVYFDQNMITSGRWFLTVACGISSYYTLPWLIGILGLVYLGCSAAALCELLEIRKPWAAAAAGGLLASFPAMASAFAYVFTLDGYMLAVLLAVLAVLFTKKWNKGFLPGALCLAFSMGIYQAYLAFAMILSIFCILMLFSGEREHVREGGNAHGREDANGESAARGGRDANRGNAAQGESAAHGGKDTNGGKDAHGGRGWKDTVLGSRLLKALHYLYMGILGAGLYYGILQVLLRLEGKALADYQGIDGMVPGAAALSGIPSAVAAMYRDFLSFTFRGNVLAQNVFSAGACILLAGAATAGAVQTIKKRKCWKNPAAFAIMGLAAAALPVASDIILLISPSVNYHLLMRYQWVLYLIGAVALAGNSGGGSSETEDSGQGGCGVTVGGGARPRGRTGYGLWAEWAAFLGVWVLIFCFGVTDNIAYSNLQKRYEKTYAYCIRLLDRIEQTPGYYPGIPIAMIGVVGEEQYPPTDLTPDVTSNMIGMSGDSLLYRGDNYRAFMKNYLGATLNILPAEAMEEMYYSEEYIAMESFPGKDSIRIIDGILYVKTENRAR